MKKGESKIFFYEPGKGFKTKRENVIDEVVQLGRKYNVRGIETRKDAADLIRGLEKAGVIGITQKLFSIAAMLVII